MSRNPEIDDQEEMGSIWHDVESVCSEESVDDERDFLEKICRDQLAVAKGEVALSNLLDSAIGHRLQDVDSSEDASSEAEAAGMPKEISAKEILKPSLARGVRKSGLAFIVLIVTLVIALTIDYISHGAVFQQAIFQQPTALIDHAFVPVGEIVLADRVLHQIDPAEVVLDVSVPPSNWRDSSKSSDEVASAHEDHGTNVSPGTSTGLDELQYEGSSRLTDASNVGVTGEFGGVASNAAFQQSTGLSEEKVAELDELTLKSLNNVSRDDGVNAPSSPGLLGQNTVLVALVVGLLGAFAVRMLSKLKAVSEQASGSRRVDLLGEISPVAGSVSMDLPKTPSRSLPVDSENTGDYMISPSKYELRSSSSAGRTRKSSARS